MTPEELASRIAAVWGNPAAEAAILRGHADLAARAGRAYADAELARMLRRAERLVRSEVRRGIRTNGH